MISRLSVTVLVLLQRDYNFIAMHSWVQAEEGFYFIGKDISGLLKQKFQLLVGDQPAGPQVVEVVMGRKLQVFLLLLSQMHQFVVHDFLLKVAFVD